jgi:hypothetical protein
MLCSSTGEGISQAKMRPVEDLRNILGDYLFEAMKASNWRKEEERTAMLACTSAVHVSFPSGDDSKLEVMLRFMRGKDVYAEIYPSYVFASRTKHAHDIGNISNDPAEVR